MTDDEVDGNAIIPFAYGKALLSTRLYLDLMHECQGNFWNATQGDSRVSPHLRGTMTFSVTFSIVTQCYYSVSLVCCILLTSVYRVAQPYLPSYSPVSARLLSHVYQLAHLCLPYCSAMSTILLNQSTGLQAFGLHHVYFVYTWQTLMLITCMQ